MVTVTGSIWVDGDLTTYGPKTRTSDYTFHGSIRGDGSAKPGPVGQGSLVTFFFLISNTANPRQGAYRYVTCRVT